MPRKRVGFSAVLIDRVPTGNVPTRTVPTLNLVFDQSDYFLRDIQQCHRLYFCHYRQFFMND